MSGDCSLVSRKISIGNSYPFELVFEGGRYRTSVNNDFFALISLGKELLECPAGGKPVKTESLGW
jgi:hypothetical protein